VEDNDGCAVEVHGSEETKETKDIKGCRESQKSEYFNRSVTVGYTQRITVESPSNTRGYTVDTRIEYCQLLNTQKKLSLLSSVLSVLFRPSI
jgi:hypothetical protein